MKKTKKTSIKKYGKDHYMKCLTEEEKQHRYNIIKDEFWKTICGYIIQKRKNTCRKKYNGFDSKMDLQLWNNINNLSFAIPLFTKEEYFLDRRKKQKWKCCFCGKQFFAVYRYGKLMSKCFCQKFNGISNEEKQILEFCQIYFINFKENFRQIIYPSQLDIYIPEIKLGIEFNGVYWHSLQHRDKGYHLKKTLLCQKKEIRLTHIWQDEWKNRKEEIKNRLISIFKGNQDLLLTDQTITLDRCWYSKLVEIPGYQLIEEKDPQIIIRDKIHQCQNCGYLIYKRKQVNNNN